MAFPNFAYNPDPALNLVLCYFGNASSCEARIIDRTNYAEALKAPQTGGNTFSLTPQSATIVDKTPNAQFVNGCNPGAQ